MSLFWKRVLPQGWNTLDNACKGETTSLGLSCRFTPTEALSFNFLYILWQFRNQLRLFAIILKCLKRYKADCGESNTGIRDVLFDTKTEYRLFLSFWSFFVAVQHFTNSHPFHISTWITLEMSTLVSLWIPCRYQFLAERMLGLHKNKEFGDNGVRESKENVIRLVLHGVL